MVEEIGELELGDGLPERKLRESRDDEDPLEGCPGCPYIEFGARSHTKKKVPLTEGS